MLASNATLQEIRKNAFKRKQKLFLKYAVMSVVPASSEPS